MHVQVVDGAHFVPRENAPEVAALILGLMVRAASRRQALEEVICLSPAPSSRAAAGEGPVAGANGSGAAASDAALLGLAK